MYLFQVIRYMHSSDGMKTLITKVRIMTRTSGFRTAKCTIFHIYFKRKEIILIFFRHFVERPANIFTRSSVIGLLLRHYQRH